MTVYAYLVAGVVLLVGIAGIATSRNLVHAVVSLSVAQSATYTLLIAVGYQNGGLAPIFGSQVGRDTPVVDPVVQALTLTDIVVSAAVTSMLLALVIQMAKRRRAIDPDDLGPLKG